MTDRYRLTTPPAHPDDPSGRRPARRTDPATVLLWVVIALAAPANVALSAVGLDLLAVPFGVAVLAAGAALVVRHRGRAS